MSCDSVQERISSHLDGRLSARERRDVLTHINLCKACNARLKDYASVRTSLRKLPKAQVPARLATQLRVVASHELARQQARANFSARLQYWSDRIRLQFDNLMRPMALPFAGALFSAALLFAALVPNLGFAYRATDEPPLSFSSDPDGQVVGWTGEFPRLASIHASSSGDVALELTIDTEGRVVDYAVSQGRLTPEMESIILFSRFTPAMFFGKPTYGKKVVFFRHPAGSLKS